eukprot:TRINITY_DN39625_c0_g1_i1.p1 TRINITY_DN39625_c0_g1~~TRINITY_DN39625_c0_g1_i1.p1  ORF type:complete len:509 (+),score=48.19 TRINITY_DN39625_c0_g1_i1:84-1610(+)
MVAFCHSGCRRVLLAAIVLAACLARAEDSDQVCSAEDWASGICTRAKVEKAPPVQVVAFITNSAAKPRAAYWVGPDGEVAMGDIAPGERMRYNTFPGHTFAFRVSGDHTGTAERVTIEATQEKEYFIGQGVTDEDDDSEPRPDSIDWAKIQSFRDSFPVMFRNLCGSKVKVWYVPDGGSPVHTSTIAVFGYSTTVSYQGHVFCFTPASETRGCGSAIAQYAMDRDRHVYVVDDGSGHKDDYEHWEKESQFRERYLKENGRPWIGFWPREPPLIYMHPAEAIGTEIHMPTSKPLQPAPEGMKEGSMLTLRVLSTEPRVFLVPHFLTEEEADHIVQVAKDKVVQSMTGSTGDGKAQSTRTSRNTFIPRSTSPTIDDIFLRVAELLNISNDRMQHTDAAELLQVVHYSVGQKYDAHHDFAVHGIGNPHIRCLTLLLYLNNPANDGQTAFPKSKHEPGDKPVVTHPGKGAAVLFYNVLPDGNPDELSLHASLPVTRGEKWIANVWFWDPKRH